MTRQKYNLYLASQSPRRKELLGHMGVSFKVVVSHVQEISVGKTPDLVSKENAKRKAYAVFQDLNDPCAIVVSADTIVVFENEILGKPDSVESARKTLQKLSGQKHVVITAVCIKSLNREKLFSIQSEVAFDHITDDIMEHYLSTQDSLDKAGAYGIQSEGLLFVNSVTGSYSNVVGFPLNDFIKHLKHLYKVDDYRELFE